MMATLEHILRQQGLPALEAASTTSVSRIATQLATLPVAEDDAAMQDLQEFMLSILSARNQLPAVKAANPPPAFVGTNAIEVSEGSMTDFMRVDQAYRPAAD